MVPSKITVTRVAAARTRQLTSTAVRRINAASRADGAGETGLTRLIWTHALNCAGDTLIAISLAGTLFFAAATGEQRTNVALYLIVTMAPFAIVAPIIGPALDRLQRGRRWALASTMGGRAVLAWIMAANYDNFALYPAAFGALVLAKAYGVLKGAVVPRVLPGEMTLVTANARLSIFGLLTGAVFAGVGFGVASLLGFTWELGLTAVVFVAAGAVALSLPEHVDHSEGELPASVLTTGSPGSLTGSGRRSLGIRVITALRCVATLRGLAGFLTIFSPFLVQGTIGGVEGTLVLAAIAGGAGLGSFIGTAIGARARLTNPDVVVLVLTGIAAVGCLVAAFAYSIATVIAVALVAGVTNALGKHGLDAIIQRDVPESLRSSAFARSETLLQITWVFGGAIAISLPLIGWIAFTVAAVLIVTAATLTLIGSRKRRGGTPAPTGQPA
ncbi:MAG: MFS transporter [Geodermatophilaceae bacterium]|nr:MFS transporter [Geodermatophilaceae bacterium]MDQ3463245.1 MFS transporter [Actinomycetota bacterium]